MGVTVSVVIAQTHRVDDLLMCVESLRDQVTEEDQVIISVDPTGPDAVKAQALVMSTHEPYQGLIAPAPHKCWGHHQLNAGLRIADGDWILCMRDDAILSPDALDTVRDVAERLIEPRPLLFRYICSTREILWGSPRVDPEEITGYGLCAPNRPGMVGRWSCRLGGDFDYVADTLDKWGVLKPPVWRHEIIGVERPDRGVLRAS